MRPLTLAMALTALAACASPPVYDVVIYGGTSAGVMAAVQASRLGRSVVLIEPGWHLGGMTSSGLGATDIGNKAAIGGLAREFYRQIGRHYANPSSWRHQLREEYRSVRQRGDEEEMWTFEPHVAEEIMNLLVAGAHVPLVLGEHLDLQGGVVMADREIQAIRMESGRSWRGRMFIDASYEGDLMAGAGVSYHVGRESNATYGETLNGVQTARATHHQFRHAVDPWVVPGDPRSGLLPEVSAEGPGQEGAGDRRVQAYNFRLCLTDVPENRIPFRRPPGYDPRRYEILLRYFEAGFDQIPWHSVGMPNRKTDTNNNHAFSTDWIGGSHAYPEANHATRAGIVAAHREYLEGLLWCLSQEPRVPEKVRAEVSRWGLCRDEFGENGGWPHQIYVREARRMQGTYVMTQHECQGRRQAPDPVGLAAYTMDSHNVQRHVARDQVRNEGDVQVAGFPPYPIGFGALVPRSEECTNLIVPVALSASHIAYGSIRMEPVFMVLGQSAATAAGQALEEGAPIQEIDRARLRSRLLADGQLLSWPPPESTAPSAPGG